MVSEVILSRFSGYFCIKKVFSEFILCLHVLTLDFIWAKYTDVLWAFIVHPGQTGALSSHIGISVVHIQSQS